MFLKIERLPDAAAVAARGARVIAEAARAAVTERGRFAFAVSGGRTPGSMLEALAGEDLPWERVHLFQVDERVAPAGDPDRNWTQVCERLLGRVPLGARAHPMPVEDGDLDAAAQRYAVEIESVCGKPAVLDLVHLGLGADGHTASLVPGDAALDVADADVAVTAPYQGRRRMTLTFPVLARARRVLWIVTGAEKRDALAALVRGDRSIPASRVAFADQILLTDQLSTWGQTPS